MKKFILLTLFAASIFLSCKKDDGLTKETQIGANTFSCLIDGKAFVPKEGWTGGGLYGTYDAQRKKLVIGAGNVDTKQNFSITINGIYTGIGTYTAEKNQLINIIYSANDKYYYTQFTGQGHIIITRSDNKIVSGSFEFVAQDSKDPNDVITCTKGRFDLVVEGI